MDHNEPDGVNEALSGTLRVSLTVAGQVAERVSRQRAQEMRGAAAADQDNARQLQSRLAAQRSAALASLAPTSRAEWWEGASPDQIAAAWQTAQTWRDLDPAARDAAERMSEELQRRYDLDTGDLRGDPAAVRAALAERDHDRDGGRDARQRADGEEADALALLATADRAEDNVAAPSADRDERDAAVGESETSVVDAVDHLATREDRAELAASLEGVADEEAISARVLATTNQGRPAAEAVASPSRRPGPAARARRGGPVRDRGPSR